MWPADSIVPMMNAMMARSMPVVRNLVMMVLQTGAGETFSSVRPYLFVSEGRPPVHGQ
jgi:hypothetical protein